MLACGRSAVPKNPRTDSIFPAISWKSWSISQVIACDIHSFAVLRRNAYAGTLEIAFTWLGGDKNSLSGYQDTIILPYDEMMEHLHESVSENEPIVWKVLSADDSAGQARIVFKSRKNLHAALGNGVIRRKLIRFLRDQFRWGNSEEIDRGDNTGLEAGFRKCIRPFT